MLEKMNLFEIVNEVEESPLVSGEMPKRISPDWKNKYLGIPKFSAVNAVASGHIDGIKFLNLLKEGISYFDARERSKTFPGRSSAFLGYARSHQLMGPLRIVETSLEKSGTRSATWEVLDKLGLDRKKRTEYQIRVASKSNFNSITEAIDHIDQFGFERDLDNCDNLFWYCTGKIYGGELNLSKQIIFLVYHDPKRLMDRGSTVLDEGAMGYYGLVKARVTLRDLLLPGGVIIHRPKE